VSAAPGRAPGGLQAVLVDHLVYTTITMMSVLVVYDGWPHLSVAGVAGVIAGPVLAMFISHVFAATLARHVALQRRLSAAEWGHVVLAEAPFLLFAVPPLAILALLDAAGLPVTQAIRVVLWIGTASLGAWSGLAGRRAGLRGGPLVLAVLFGLAAGFIVLALQVYLQPGRAFSGAAALGRPA
jgi:hypothetical protein